MVAPIARDLEAVERVYTETLASAKPHLNRLIEHLNHYKGKRLRPMLLLLSARACGPVVKAHHILGAVVEMIHTATLVHDDVLDEAGTRRHVRTVNAGWGNKTSILLGDYLFTHAFHLTSTTGDARACELIGEATNRVCEGELRQTYESGNLNLTEEDYFDIIDGKTAALTACCCRLGAMYAGADAATIEDLAEYGRLLGRAFQVADDLLDLAGTEAKAGKTLGTDLEQRKMTLPLIRVLDSVPAAEAEQLRTMLAATGNHKLEQLRPALEQTQALSYARRRAEEFAKAAAARLERLSPSTCKDVLLALTKWSVSRES
ncbi:MAG: polyprenyl synthetase family protein [Gemmataceae bacterium]|nr:polyprenyl synthetase family protein [Gemmataceae bacterium]